MEVCFVLCFQNWKSVFFQECDLLSASGIWALIFDFFFFFLFSLENLPCSLVFHLLLNGEMVIKP